MTDGPSSPSASETCTLCGGELTDRRIEADGHRFCCAGCRDVHTTLGTVEDSERQGGDEDTESGTTQPGAHTADTDLERTFLRVDGMHSATCETFLEDLATRQDGVDGAEASYVTETVRVDHAVDGPTAEDLAEALSGAGYSAYPREEELTDPDPNTVSTAGAQRNPTPHQARGLGDMLGYRYAAGVLFGSFLLLPYVALLYPTHLAALVDWGFLGMYSELVTFDQRGGFGVLRLFALVSGIVLVFTGLPLLQGAYVSLKTRRPDTNLLVATTVIAAYVYSIAAGVAGRTDVLFDLTVVIAAAVVAVVFYESLSKQRAMDRLTELTVAQVDEATRVHPEGPTSTVPVEELEAGDRVLVREGDRVPVDGTLAEGPCTVDEAVVTGESLPVTKTEGETVVGGSVVVDGGAILTVGETAESSVDRLVTSVWELQSATHGVQQRANRLTARILPAVGVLAVLAAAVAFALAGPVPALLAFLATFVVACPWGLGLAAPLSVATSIEEALRRGIVVFDETVFERLRDVDVVVFDKTGTLTTGQMHVVETDAPEDLLAAAATLERRVSHPVAGAVVSAFGPSDDPDDELSPGDRVADGGVADEQDDRTEERESHTNEDATDTNPEGDTAETNPEGDTAETNPEGDTAETNPEGDTAVESFESHPDGVGGVVDGTEVLVGHPDRFDAEGWAVSEDLAERVEAARGFGRLPVLVGRDGSAEGIVVVGDEPREGWDAAVSGLAERGIEVVVLTGDDEAATDYFRDHPGVTHVFAGVPPAGKTETIRRLQADGEVTMVGDGTNDAPALAQSDLGVSLGSGTAIASDAADLVVVDDDLAAVGRAFDLARAAGQRLAWNTRFALGYNAVAIPLALFGTLNPLVLMAGVIASGGLVGANSSRDLL